MFEWLAQYRTVVGRLFVAAVLVYVLLAGPPPLAGSWVGSVGGLVGFMLLSLAAMGRLWCLVFIAGKKDRILVTEGPYSTVRNPLYLCNLLGAVGFGLAVEQPALAALMGAALAAFLPATVAREEKRLAATFGAAYAEYCARTPRWLPDFRLYREPPTLTVYPRRISRGLLNALWFLWAYLFAELLEALWLLGGASAPL